MKRIISVSSIVLLSSIALLGFSNLVKAQGAVECVHDGVSTAVCVDESGNAAASTVHEDGTQTTVGVGADGSTSVQVDSPPQ